MMILKPGGSGGWNKHKAGVGNMEDRSGELRQALDRWELCNDMPTGVGAVVRAAVEEVENINAEPMAYQC